MIVFIISLKSRQVSKDWVKVCWLLERTVRSIVNQTSESFRLIIVCHERPGISIKHSAIKYVEVDFSPPKLGQVNIISQMDRDKNQKMWLGLEYAAQFNPSHVMFVNADDCVSCRIAEFFTQKPSVNGWFLDSGYVYEDDSDCIYRKDKNFYLMSGTSHIVAYSLMRQDNDMRSIYVDSGEPLHQLVVDMLASNKKPLKPLPFPGAVYVIENGENINADKKSDRLGREDVLSCVKNVVFDLSTKIANPNRFSKVS
jgi:hypothetical protein